MVKHIILWQLKVGFSVDQAEAVKAEIKIGLESLNGKIPGLVDICVQTEGLLSSNADLMLDSTFENEEALKGYAAHPEHVKVADAKVRPNIQTRICMDYII